MPDVFQIVAQKIRDEMVCCNIYKEMMDVFRAQGIEAYREMKRSSVYHAICYYGEMAAQYVEEERDESQRLRHEPL